MILTIFSVRPFHRSSPIALYCLLVVAIRLIFLRTAETDDCEEEQ